MFALRVLSPASDASSSTRYSARNSSLPLLLAASSNKSINLKSSAPVELSTTKINVFSETAHIVQLRRIRSLTLPKSKPLQTYLPPPPMPADLLRDIRIKGGSWRSQFAIAFARWDLEDLYLRWWKKIEFPLQQSAFAPVVAIVKEPRLPLCTQLQYTIKDAIPARFQPVCLCPKDDGSADWVDEDEGNVFLDDDVDNSPSPWLEEFFFPMELDEIEEEEVVLPICLACNPEEDDARIVHLPAYRRQLSVDACRKISVRKSVRTRHRGSNLALGYLAKQMHRPKRGRAVPNYLLD